MTNIPEKANNSKVKGVYINLDQRTDRRLHMENSLLGCGFTVERFVATRFTESKEELEKKLSKSIPPLIAVTSIWESHRLAIEHLLKSDAGILVVMEDDLQIKPEFWLDFEQKIENHDFEWDLILYTPRYRPKKLIAGKPSNFIPAPLGTQPTKLSDYRDEHYITGAHYCVYNRTGALLALAAIHKSKRIYDIDRFFVDTINVYGIHDDRLFAGKMGSDHV